MIYLTIFNTICVLLILFLLLKDKFSFRIEETIWDKTKLGIQFYFNNKGFLYIPFRNKHKAVLREDVLRLIASSEQNRKQSLNAIFSWLKTWEEVRQFEKDYSVVDRRIVENLVSNFTPKTNGTQ